MRSAGSAGCASERNFLFNFANHIEEVERYKANRIKIDSMEFTMGISGNDFQDVEECALVCFISNVFVPTSIDRSLAHGTLILA
jgi:hypothetical protein